MKLCTEKDRFINCGTCISLFSFIQISGLSSSLYKFPPVNTKSITEKPVMLNAWNPVIKRTTLKHRSWRLVTPMNVFLIDALIVSRVLFIVGDVRCSCVEHVKRYHLKQ